jgi:hypothetical protein
MQPAWTSGQVALGCLTALVGGILGGAAGLLITYALLSGVGANALVWAVTFMAFGAIGVVLGAAAAAGIAGFVRDRKSMPR